MHTSHKTGFTLIEILLVVAAIAILAGIVILAINPTKQLGDTRNAARHSDVTTILNAIYQYAIDNNGTVPAAISTSPQEVCKTGQSCTGADLSVLTTNEKYLVSMPIDPSNNSVTSTRYEVQKDSNNRITVTAMDAEQGVTISATR